MTIASIPRLNVLMLCVFHFMGASLGILILHLLKNCILSKATEITWLCVEYKIRTLNSLKTPILHMSNIFEIFRNLKFCLPCFFPYTIGKSDSFV